MDEIKLAINQEPILVLNKRLTVSSTVGAYLSEQIQQCKECDEMRSAFLKS